jgi:hypothetical protein
MSFYIPKDFVNVMVKEFQNKEREKLYLLCLCHTILNSLVST